MSHRKTWSYLVLLHCLCTIACFCLSVCFPSSCPLISLYPFTGFWMLCVIAMGGFVCTLQLYPWLLFVSHESILRCFSNQCMVSLPRALQALRRFACSSPVFLHIVLMQCSMYLKLGNSEVRNYLASVISIKLTHITNIKYIMKAFFDVAHRFVVRRDLVLSLDVYCIFFLWLKGFPALLLDFSCSHSLCMCSVHKQNKYILDFQKGEKVSATWGTLQKESPARPLSIGCENMVGNVNCAIANAWRIQSLLPTCFIPL